MNLLSFPELFYLISINLNDKEKILLITNSKKTYNLRSLIKLDLEYEINDKLFGVKNIIIKDFSLETEIKELLENLIPESITVYSKYVRFVSNNINVKLFYSEEIIRKIVSYGYHYLAMKIMLNNDGSIENINNQFIKSLRRGYLEVVKLLIENGANVQAQYNEAIIWASKCGYLEVVKLLIENGPPKVVPTFSSPSSPPAPSGASIQAQNNQAIIWASCWGYIEIVKLLINLGADVRAQDNQAIIWASQHGHIEIVKLLIKYGADFKARNDTVIIWASVNGYLEIVQLLMNLGANIENLLYIKLVLKNGNNIIKNLMFLL